jgi:hypothetical protein
MKSSHRIARVMQRSCGIIRLDRDIRLNIDIQGIQIITQETGRLALNLSIIKCRLHLHVLQIRRSGARLGQEHRVRIIGIDILGACSIAGTLQLQRRE